VSNDHVNQGNFLLLKILGGCKKIMTLPLSYRTNTVWSSPAEKAGVRNPITALFYCDILRSHLGKNKTLYYLCES
jgi:hypothetical protein